MSQPKEPTPPSTPRPTSAERFREAEMEWLRTHGDDLAALPPGEWVAIDGVELIAHGRQLLDVLNECIEKGHPDPFITATPEHPGVPFYGAVPGPPTSAEREGDAPESVLVEAVRRYERAINHLYAVMENREQARGLQKPSFIAAWKEGSRYFVEFGNWLDIEVDRHMEAK